MYTITLSNGIVTRDSDGVTVAPCQDAQDPAHLAYVTWCNSGNSPTIVQHDATTLAAQDAAALAQNNQDLWVAADSYEAAGITGLAVGLLTVGVMKGTAKALAIAAWSASIWNLYYVRKALLTPVMDYSLLDFSSCGPIPYSIPELRSELGM